MRVDIGHTYTYAMPEAMRKVFIVAPGDAASAGPEACHQLADVLNQHVQRAYMLYLPLGRRYETPPMYRQYRAPSVEQVEPGSIVVVPESAAPVTTWWPECDIYFWWMSVDGFTISANSRGQHPGDELQTVQRHVTKHLYASDYARRFLDYHGISASRLADPLSREYLTVASKQPNVDRRNLLVYNPKKGMNRTQKILDELDNRGETLKVVAITEMDRSDIEEALSQAKIYIDFGFHPGKDRLPREAAAYGACVLTNRRGSANNSIDVPIPDDFKVDDRIPGFEQVAADKIQAVLADFAQQQPRFNDYRKKISQESRDFISDVAAMDGLCSDGYDTPQR